MKAEDVEKIFEKGFLDPLPQPHYGGLITDPLPAKVRALEDRIAVLEDIIKTLTNGK